MKIALVSVAFPPIKSGVSTTTYELANQLTRLGNDMLVLTSKQKGLNPNNYNFEVVRFLSIKNPLRKNYRVGLPMLPSVKKILNNFEPNIIHIHDASPLSLASVYYAKKRKIPIIATHHFLPGFISSYVKGVPIVAHLVDDRLDKFLWQEFKNIYKPVNRVICPTIIAEEALQKYGVNKPIDIVSNGVDLEKHKPGKSDWLYKKLDLDKSKKIFLYFGRVDKDKRLDTLIKAWGKIKAKNKKGWYLVIGGDGTERKKLTADSKINKSDGLFLTGRVDDKNIVNIYQSARAYIMPSPIESQSITTLMALSYGLPVITSNKGAVKLLVDNNKNGWIYKFDEKGKNLKEVLVRLMKASDKKLIEFGERSRKKAFEHDINLLGKSTVEVYKKAIGS